MRHVASILPLCLIATSAYAASPIAVTAGEHETYSRVVIGEGAQDASLSVDGKRVYLFGLDPSSEFDLTEVNQAHKAHRIESARPVSTTNGRAIEFSLNCACSVQTKRLPNGKFVIDVRESGALAPKPIAKKTSAAPKPEPSTETPTKKAAPAAKKTTKFDEADTLSVQEAHSRMIALLKEAAREGLVDIREEKIKEEKAAAAKKTLTVPEHTKDEDENAHGHSQDLDAHAAAGHPVGATMATPASASSAIQCYPNHDTFIDGAEFETDPMVRIAELKAMLGAPEDDHGDGYDDGHGKAKDSHKKEAKKDKQKDDHASDHDAIDTDAVVRNLAAGFLSIGFGEEALGLLVDHHLDHTAYGAIAKLVAERSLDENHRLNQASQCAGGHALWEAVAAPAKDAPLAFVRSGEEIDRLPIRLKAIISTRLAYKMIEAEAWSLAQQLYDKAVATEIPAGADLRYVEALLEEHHGEADTAHKTLVDLSEENTTTADNALMSLADTYAKDGELPYTGYTEDLGALAKRTGSSEATLAEAVTWADIGNFSTSMFLLKSLAGKTRNELVAARTTANGILSKALADQNKLTQLAALNAVLDNKSWIFEEGEETTLRKMSAHRATQLGVPNLAFSFVGENNASTEDRYLAANAALNSDLPDIAIQYAAPFVSQPEFAGVVVKANIDKGAHHDALASSAAIKSNDDNADLAARAAWLARAWRVATDRYNALESDLMDEEKALHAVFSAYMAREKSAPTTANAILAEKNDVLARGATSLFSDEPSGSALERSTSSVDRARDTLAMFEEILSDG